MSSINKIKVIGGGETYGLDGDYNTNGFTVQQLKFTGNNEINTLTLDRTNGIKITGKNPKQTSQEIEALIQVSASGDCEIKSSGLIRTWTGIRVGSDGSVNIGGREQFNIGVGGTIDLSKAKKTLAIGSYLTSESQDGQILIGYRNDPTEAGFAGYAIVVSGAAKDTTGNVFRVSRTTGTTIIGRERKVTLDGDGTIKATSLTLGDTTLTETQLQSLLALLTKSTEA